MKTILLAVSIVANCLAADPSPVTRSHVRVIHVKADMNTEFLDLQKTELIPALKKAGVKSRTFYETRFGTRGEYVVITPVASLGEYEGDSPLTRALGAAGAARLNAKLMKCYDSVTDYIQTRQDDLSNLVEPPTPPNYVVVSRLRVSPGKLGDFRGIIKSDILPIYVKGKRRLQTSRRGFGANGNDFTAAYGIDKLSELDAGSVVLQALGNEGVERLALKYAPIFTIVETVVRHRMADLSF